MNYEDIIGYKKVNVLDKPYLLVLKSMDNHTIYLEPMSAKQINQLFIIYPNYSKSFKQFVESKAKLGQDLYIVANENILLYDDIEGLILSVDDIVNILGIPLEDKSRGSDYGD